MKLPEVAEPGRYTGLYVFDFGDWTAVGYTAEEIAVLVESEQYRDGKVYRIVRARPDGQLELRGVERSRFELESGMLFYRETEGPAREDFAALMELAELDPPPSRAFVHLVDRGPGTDSGRFAVALIYPAEFEDALGQWLLQAGYAGGDTVEGGPSVASNFYESAHTTLERQQLWSRTSGESRPAEEVLRQVKVAVQR
jgi:hypothetical protein